MTEVPTLVKIISVLTYISSGFSIILGLLAMFAGGLISSLFASLGGIGIVVGLIFIAVGVLGIFVARGLWMRKNWARIVSIIIYSLSVLGALMGVVVGSISSIINLLISGAIAGYLLFSKDVKKAFKK